MVRNLLDWYSSAVHCSAACCSALFGVYEHVNVNLVGEHIVQLWVPGSWPTPRVRPVTLLATRLPGTAALLGQKVKKSYTIFDRVAW